MNTLVQNASPSPSRPPGRPAEFDADLIVSNAVELFWQHGYAATSLAMLEDELGVNRSTLYTSFDGKSGLYGAAVSCYIDSMERLLVEPLLNGTEGIDDLIAFVEGVRTVLNDPVRPEGCLVVNAMAAGDAPTAMHDYLSRMRLGLDEALRRAADVGEIDPSRCAERAASVLTSAVGLNVAAKSGISNDDLNHLVDGVRAVIESWRSASDQPQTL